MIRSAAVKLMLMGTAALVMAAIMVAMAMPALAKMKSEVYECSDGQLVLKEQAKQIEKTSTFECKKFKG